MDEILSKASNQAVSFAIKSGISLASGFAIKRVSQFLEQIPGDDKTRIVKKRNMIQIKMEIVTMSIDLIKLATSRSNTALEVTGELIDNLSHEFDVFESELGQISDQLAGLNEKESVKQVEKYMGSILEQIDEAIPILNLALTTCGVSLDRALPSQVSPGRLLQASLYITESNSAFEGKKVEVSPVGPVFDLVLYSIFYNPSRMKYIEQEGKVDELSCINWKEEFARCQACINRVPGGDKRQEYAYCLDLKENFDDGRYHEEESPPQKREYNITKISKLFFTASGKLLRLESRISPVLILKIEGEGSQEEWIGLGEVETGEFESEAESSDGDDESDKLHYEDARNDTSKLPNALLKNNSLSLLDCLIRLCILQERDQTSILDVKDERLSLYLRDENSQNAVKGVIPATKQQKLKKVVHQENVDHLLALDSNTKRLDNLKINNK